MSAAARKVARPPVAQPLRLAIAKVHLAKKELALDDDTYRATLSRVTGKASAADLNVAQLGRVLDEFRRLGWNPRPGQGAKVRQHPRAADHPVALKARALWISLHQLGEVRDPSEPALEAFAKRQLGVDRLQWADQSQGYRLIEALKAWAERAGWEQSDDVEVTKANLAALLTRRTLETDHA